MIDDHFPPRGSGEARHPETPPSQAWGHPWQLGPAWDWKPGRILLGHWRGRPLGIDDDRHGAMFAGARGGKTTTVLVPNLRRYPASVVVLDPKAELTRACADRRRAMGQNVFVCDPFGETGEQSASYNPLAELGYGRSQHVAADAALAADALIVSNPRDPHWTDSAKNLIRGFLLHELAAQGGPVSVRDLRRMLSATPAELNRLFTAMTNSAAFDGIVANIGAAFLGKLEAGGRELQSILSTAQEQTAPLDDVAAISDRSDFRMAELREGKTTIFLVLPGMRMGTHYRWLRLVIQNALCAVERFPVPRGGLPVWFMLEEFPALGHMRSIETAAGLMPGYGVKLWTILQDLTQLQTHYAKSWETFLGNAGVIQAFGNADLTTAEYLSRRLGMTQVVERQDIRVSGDAMSKGDIGRRENLRSVRLLEANELTEHFARETNRQLILVPGRPPIYCERLPRDA